MKKETWKSIENVPDETNKQRTEQKNKGKI